MSEAGYTLVETLTALAVVSLAIGGLSAAAQVLSRHQSLVGQLVLDVEAPRAAQAALEDIISGQGPFRAHEPQRFTGDARRVAFECQLTSPCEVALVEGVGGQSLRILTSGAARVLPLRRDGLRFRYEGADGPTGVWPPTSSKRQALRSLSLVTEADPAGPAWLKARIWAEQAVTCQFDPILQDCR